MFRRTTWIERPDSKVAIVVDPAAQEDRTCFVQLTGGPDDF